jgi:hypothetical protein
LLPNWKNAISDLASVNGADSAPTTALVNAARALTTDDQSMLTRCAWCDRIHLAGIWVTRDRAPTMPPDITERTTHGICPACTEVLQREGRSR